MTNARNGLTVDRLLRELNKSYRGVDLRVLLAKPSKESTNDEWISVFLKMVFTNEPEAEIESRHEKVQKLVGAQDEENLKVRLAYHEINEARNIINCISKGHISISGYLARIEGECDKIKTIEAITHDGFMDSENLCKTIFSTRGSGSVVPNLENMVGRRNVDMEIISELLDIRNLQSVIEVNVVLSFPVYFRKVEVQESEKGRILCKYEIDKNLVEKCNAKIIISTNGKRPHKEVVKLNDVFDMPQNNIALVLIQIPKDIQLSPHDYISIKIEHQELGAIRFKEDTFFASEVMKRPYYNDPLTETFKQFKASDILKDILLQSSSDEKKQVTSISWLFTLMGFRMIPLGIIGSEGEQVKQTQPTLSCDIMAGKTSNPELLVAVDCTLNVPDETKIKKIRNTADFLLQKIKKVMPDSVGIVMIPLLVSFVDCSGYTSVAQKYQVRLVDKNDLLKLYDLLLIQGLKDDALQILDLGTVQRDARSEEEDNE